MPDCCSCANESPSGASTDGVCGVEAILGNGGPGSGFSRAALELGDGFCGEAAPAARVNGGGVWKTLVAPLEGLLDRVGSMMRPQFWPLLYGEVLLSVSSVPATPRGVVLSWPKLISDLGSNSAIAGISVSP